MIEVICDGCGGTRPQGDILHGCRICNFDLCGTCNTTQLEASKYEAIKVLEVPTDGLEMSTHVLNSETTEEMDTSLSSEGSGGKITPTDECEEVEEAPVITLEDCLHRFTAAENLSENTFECEGCLGERRSASKQLTLSKLPNTLVV